MATENRQNPDFLITLVAQVLIALQGLLVVPIIVKWAGATTYGKYVLLGNLIATSFGVLTSMQYLYRRKLVSATSIAERRALIDQELTFHFVGLLVISVILAWTAADIEKLLLGSSEIVNWWILVAVLGAMFVARQVQDYFRFTLRFGIFNVTSVSSLYLFLVLGTAWVLTGNVLSLDVLFLLQVFASLSVHLPFAIMMFRELGVPRLRLPIRGLRKDIASNLPFGLEMVVDFVLAFSDRYLIAIFLTVGAVAAYQPAYQLASLVLFIPRFSTVLLVPGISRMFDSGDRLAAERLLETFMKLFLMIAVPFTVGVLMLGSSIVVLLTTPEIGAAGRWVPVLVAIGSIFYGLMLLMDPVFLALGRNSTSLAAYAAGAGVNLALNLILLPLFQNVHVAAISTLVGYAVSYVCMWSALRADWRLRVNGWGLLRYLAASAAMGLVIVAIGFDPTGGRPTDILSLAEGILVAVAVYFATLSVLGGFGRTEFTEIRGLLNFRAGKD